MNLRAASTSINSIGRVGLRAATVFAWLALGVGMAHADYCRQLEAQLAALGAGTRTNPEQLGRYDVAIASQQGELQKAREQARQARCGITASAICTSLDATIERMSGNLADLQHTRARLGSSAALQAERSRLTAQLRASGCRETQQAGQQLSPRAENAAMAGSGTRYRTLCVRMCDGFYFPISHSTPRSHFAQDEKLCSARCPGTAVQLHYHRFPGEEAEEMVSVPTGMPYRQSENAFRYRQASWERPANCGCGIDRGFEVLAGERQWQPLQGSNEGEETDRQEQASVSEGTSSGSFLIQTAAPAVPSVEPAVEDEAEAAVETDAEIAVEPEELDRTTTATERPLEPADEERPVRVVGPTFLPAPEEAIDLLSPAPYRAR
jgi:hypothetical protein